MRIKALEKVADISPFLFHLEAQREGSLTVIQIKSP